LKPFAPVDLHGRVRGLTFNPATQQWETLSTTGRAAALALKLLSLRGSRYQFILQDTMRPPHRVLVVNYLPDLFFEGRMFGVALGRPLHFRFSKLLSLSLY